MNKVKKHEALVRSIQGLYLKEPFQDIPLLTGAIDVLLGALKEEGYLIPESVGLFDVDDPTFGTIIQAQKRLEENYE